VGDAGVLNNAGCGIQQKEPIVKRHAVHISHAATQALRKIRLEAGSNLRNGFGNELKSPAFYLWLLLLVGSYIALQGYDSVLRDKSWSRNVEDLVIQMTLSSRDNDLKNRAKVLESKSGTQAVALQGTSGNAIVSDGRLPFTGHGLREALIKLPNEDCPDKVLESIRDHIYCAQAILSAASPGEIREGTPFAYPDRLRDAARRILQDSPSVLNDRSAQGYTLTAVRIFLIFALCAGISGVVAPLLRFFGIPAWGPSEFSKLLEDGRSGSGDPNTGSSFLAAILPLSVTAGGALIVAVTVTVQLPQVETGTPAPQPADPPRSQPPVIEPLRVDWSGTTRVDWSGTTDAVKDILKNIPPPTVQVPPPVINVQNDIKVDEPALRKALDRLRISTTDLRLIEKEIDSLRTHVTETGNRTVDQTTGRLNPRLDATQEAVTKVDVRIKQMADQVEGTAQVGHKTERGVNRLPQNSWQSLIYIFRHPDEDSVPTTPVQGKQQQ
jgi:hypothetical protein